MILQRCALLPGPGNLKNGTWAPFRTPSRHLPKAKGSFTVAPVAIAATNPISIKSWSKQRQRSRNSPMYAHEKHYFSVSRVLPRTVWARKRISAPVAAIAGWKRSCAGYTTVQSHACCSRVKISKTVSNAKKPIAGSNFKRVRVPRDDGLLTQGPFHRNR